MKKSDNTKNIWNFKKGQAKIEIIIPNPVVF